MPFTPQFGLPYPSRSDAPNGPSQFEQLALAIENAILSSRTLVERTSNAATFTGTENPVDSITAPLVAGRRYRVVWIVHLSDSIVNDTIALRIREDTGAGTNIQSISVPVPVVTTTYTHRLETEYVAVATGPKTFVATGQRTVGTGTVTPIANNTTQKVRIYVEQVAG